MEVLCRVIGLYLEAILCVNTICSSNPVLHPLVLQMIDMR